MKFFQHILHIPRTVLAFCIRLYQIILSPDHSFWAKKIYPHGYCKYYPTCSEYSRQVIKQRGVIVGSAKMVWRVLRCNPWSRGGVDAP